MTGLPSPPAGHLLGIDVSAAQGRLDVASLAGVSFVFVKATDGLHSVDREWNASAAALAASSLAWGAYGVLEPGEDAAAQAQHFLETLDAAPDRAPLPPALDFELAHGMTGAAALAAAATWLDTVEQALGRAAIVYCGPAFVLGLQRLAGAGGSASMEAIARRPLWVAHYTQDFARPPMVPVPWTGWTIWQASGGRAASRNFATLPGTSTDVDVDIFCGTLADLLAL